MLYCIILILIPYLLLLSVFGYIKRKEYDTAHYLIYYSIILALTSEFLMRLSGWYFKTNIAIYNISSLLEFFVIFLFYYKFIGKEIPNYIYIAVLIIFLVFYFIELSFRGLLTMFNYSFLYKNITLIVLALLALPKIINYGKISIITNYSIFWINTAILVYYSCTLFIFGLRKHTLHLSTLSAVATYLHLFFIFIFYSMLSVGLWKVNRK